LVCIDIAPHGTTQARDDADVLNVGGFSDAVFDILAAFAAGQLAAGHWLGEIESIAL
jgi:60 kDa SS-A/Ro ribonucleoprotein